jgi:hypothetical protein
MITKQVGQIKPQFTPITIEITFESQRELDVFGSLCNTDMVVYAVQDEGGSIPTYNFMQNIGADIDSRVDSLAKSLRKY